jgi:hypothetical protein
MSNDIRDILQRLATVEGRLSPAQQKVPQLPALFKPRHIRALGSKTDPAHPMDGYMVGDSVEPKRTALEEAMAEIEEDMLSKVKKDLTKYLDKLEKKVRVDRALKDKALDAVEKRQPEEIEEFAPSDDNDQGPDEEEILRRLAAMWWNGTEQQMAQAQNTLAAMGWEIGQDESGDDDAGVFLVQAGDVNGNSYMAFNHSDLDLLDELDYSASSSAAAQPTANQQAQAAGNAIKQFTPQLVKGVAADVRKFKGQDPTKDPEYAKLPPAQQQQYLQAQQTIDAADADELEKFDANKAAANIQGMAKSVVNPNNMPDTTLKSNVVDRKTAADYSPATVGGKPAATPATTPPATTPPSTSAATTDTPAATFEMADGIALECWGDDNQGYELRHGERVLPSRFKNLDHAGMAVKLYQARKQKQQQPEQDLSQDYIEER